ncbi:MAG: hypothetical protein PHI12_08980 [Dehalococcoidales bacterium]|nr:hypothetical protein [Dehalococcoidales bacterium]
MSHISSEAKLLYGFRVKRGEFANIIQGRLQELKMCPDEWEIDFDWTTVYAKVVHDTDSMSTTKIVEESGCDISFLGQPDEPDCFIHMTTIHSAKPNQPFFLEEKHLNAAINADGMIANFCQIFRIIPEKFQWILVASYG